MTEFDNDNTAEILELIETNPDARAVLSRATWLLGRPSSVEEAAEDIQRFLSSAFIMKLHGLWSSASWLDDICGADETDWIMVAERILKLEGALP
ncbi:MAG TPA: hypothetical protein VGO31_10330 [Microbacteriaceae bacterium]|nr:hypothetical protein [Microbacteriaceae bacterium]